MTYMTRKKSEWYKHLMVLKLPNVLTTDQDDQLTYEEHQ
jgi:hypothetical protein